MLVVVLALALIVVDARFDKLSAVRSALATGLTPIYWLSNAPTQFSDWVASLLDSKGELKRDNEELQARLMVLQRRALKYAALASENNELRRLMNSSEVLDDRVIVSQVVSVSPDPFAHEVVINKGRSDGVHEGQAILDSGGLMGQVTRVSQVTSRVLLVSDSSHAVPVEVVRNGLRGILLGTGKVNSLELVHLPDTANIREGDLLVSSGLGGRFPRGYPVAEVSRISKEPGEPFIGIEAKPTAKLNQSRMLLVVFQAPAPPDSGSEDQPAPAPASAAAVERLPGAR